MKQRPWISIGSSRKQLSQGVQRLLVQIHSEDLPSLYHQNQFGISFVFLNKFKS